MMEIKDVNNSGLLNLLQANRVNLQNGDVGFENFLSSFKSDGLSADTDNENEDFVARKEAASSDFSKPEVKEKAPYLDKNADSKSEKMPRKSENKNEKKADRRPENMGGSEKRTENSSPENAEKPGLAKQNVEKAETAEDVSVPEIKEELPDAGEISLDALALMNVVMVANPENGELMPVNGAELAVRLNEVGAETVSLDLSSGLPQVLPVSDESLKADAFQDVVRLLQPVEGETFELSGAEILASTVEKAKGDMNAVSEISDNQTLVDEQAAALGEIVGKDKKVKVEVNVKSEKIADVVDKGLMAVKAPVVDNSHVVENVETPNPLTEGMSRNGTAAENQAPSQVSGVAFTAAVPVVNNSVVSDGAVAAPSENGSITLAHASAAGGEMLSGAGRAPANDDTTSFRDVYKGMGKEVVEQIKVNITKSAVKGVDTIDIRLKPEELGHIQVKMQIGKDGKLQAHIISSRPETAEILQKEMAGLQKAFDEAGFRTDENSLSFSFRNEEQTGRDQERNNLRNFIGRALEQETVQDAAGGDIFGGMAWDGTSGLNIRV